MYNSMYNAMYNYMYNSTICTTICTTRCTTPCTTLRTTLCTVVCTSISYYTIPQHDYLPSTIDKYPDGVILDVSNPWLSFQVDSTMYIDSTYFKVHYTWSKDGYRGGAASNWYVSISGLSCCSLGWCRQLTLLHCRHGSSLQCRGNIHNWHPIYSGVRPRDLAPPPAARRPPPRGGCSWLPLDLYGLFCIHSRVKLSIMLVQERLIMQLDGAYYNIHHVYIHTYIHTYTMYTYIHIDW